ncbi:hypothetical protein GCM10020221_01210 [Streptomyces thioluteus]|uniref:Malonyl-CoA:ACP transacylase (MAT) domain-containing protein n=1 Tax=Streptomyces thioluteus TaxID=66431 RepID=A0ABN3WD89_STRTU
MAAELMSTSPVFRESIEACEKSLAPYVDWSLTKVLRGRSGAPTLERVDVVQPALFAVMVSLAALWRSFGVEPAAVVGHSQGEIAAAHVAGALSLDDAARIVAVRSKALRVLSGRGGMVSVAAPVDRVLRELERWDGSVSVAAVNGPARRGHLRRPHGTGRGDRGVHRRRSARQEDPGGLRLALGPGRGDPRDPRGRRWPASRRAGRRCRSTRR